MCKICKNPKCNDCSKPPAGLTKKELQNNGWNNQPSLDELERIRKFAQNAIDPIKKR